MRVRLNELIVSCQRKEEIIPLHHFNYFFGHMGAGKSSIVRLIDYCFGGDIELTAAMQQHFVAVTLNATINDNPLTLYRHRETDLIRAQWQIGEQSFDAVIPARHADGERVPDTGIEVMSDLLFHVAGVTPPRVRKSKRNIESKLVRLSLRNLLWYCYLDQDTIDSSFYNLDADADQFKRLQSRDVIRYLLGYHQERVTELEIDLSNLREKKAGIEEGARTIRQMLESIGIGSKEQTKKLLVEIEEEIAEIDKKLASIVDLSSDSTEHATDLLRENARKVAYEIVSLEDACANVDRLICDEQRHLNELLSLSIKFRRSLAAKEALDGLEFRSCPSCSKELPTPEDGHCRLCNQKIDIGHMPSAEVAIIENDIEARKRELEESIRRRQQQLIVLREELRQKRQYKSQFDIAINKAMSQYDSAYLSSSLALERVKAAKEQEIVELNRLLKLSEQIVNLEADADLIAQDEGRVRRELAEARSIS